MGGSCDRIEKAVADSRQWVVFLLASWKTAVKAPHARKKWTFYNILRRNSHLKDTIKCGLNLDGPIAEKLSVLCRAEICFGFNTTGDIYCNTKEHLLKIFCSVQSVCEIYLTYCICFWKWLLLSFEWEFTRAVKRNVKWGEIAWRCAVVIRYIPEVFNGFSRKILLILETPRLWRTVIYRSARSSAQNTEIVAFIFVIQRNI
jgi:hypothetical protein